MMTECPTLGAGFRAQVLHCYGCRYRCQDGFASRTSHRVCWTSKLSIHCACMGWKMHHSLHVALDLALVAGITRSFSSGSLLRGKNPLNLILGWVTALGHCVRERYRYLRDHGWRVRRTRLCCGVDISASAERRGSTCEVKVVGRILCCTSFPIRLSISELRSYLR